MTTEQLNLTDSYKNFTAIIFLHLFFFSLSIFLITYYSLLISVPIFVFIAFVHQKFLGEYLHEASHYNLYKNKFVNEFIGNFLVGIFLFIPTSNYRKLHFNHHSHKTFFKDNDPETSNLIIYKKSDFWKNILIDLTGYNGLKVLLGYTFHKQKSSERTKHRSDITIYIFALVHLFIFILLIIYNYYMYYLMYMFTAGTFYKLQGRFRVLCQHIFINKNDSKVQYKITTSRTIVGGLLEKIFFTSNIVAYHDLHHRYPAYPYRRLKKMFEKSNPKEEINSYSKTRFNIIKRYYKSLSH